MAGCQSSLHSYLVIPGYSTKVMTLDFTPEERHVYSATFPPCTASFGGADTPSYPDADVLSAPPNEAGGREGLRAINMLPLWGKAVLPISGDRAFAFSGQTQLGGFKNVPSRSSSNAFCSCSCVFITIGPYHATGSLSGSPDTSRKRMPSSPA